MRRLFPVSTVLLAINVFANAQTPATPAKKPVTRHKAATTAKKPAAEAKPVASGPAKFTTDQPKAIFDTTAGTLTCTLFPKQAPKTVDNFVGLATGSKAWIDPYTHKPMQGKPLYDGTIFHRVIPNFMIQGGDPLGNGQGEPGYSFEDEFSPDLRFDQPGRLAMANSGPNTNGSQFFITEVPTPHLNNRHTIFGQCDDESVELVRKIARMPRGENDKPDQDVKINHITIEGLEKPPAVAKKAAPAKKTTAKPAAKAGAKTSTTPPKKPQ